MIHPRFYPYHYAPYVSDIKGFSDIVIDFDVGHPFLPFEQLLAVLPPASKSLLPKAYQVSGYMYMYVDRSDGAYMVCDACVCVYQS